MGISLMYPVQGQLHAQDEDDLEAMGWSLVRDREGVAVYNRQFADSKVRGVMARAEVDVESARIFAVITRMGISALQGAFYQGSVVRLQSYD
jgi:hypothetical protein